ncbi:hypothetical protein F4823DRAFT_635245 [Ustulina deusta]|nr:hypothetical protein F4823DRAFT_635245 [Ustulina deusta]
MATKSWNGLALAFCNIALEFLRPDSAAPTYRERDGHYHDTTLLASPNVASSPSNADSRLGSTDRQRASLAIAITSRPVALPARLSRISLARFALNVPVFESFLAITPFKCRLVINPNENALSPSYRMFSSLEKSECVETGGRMKRESGRVFECCRKARLRAISSILRYSLTSSSLLGAVFKLIRTAKSKPASSGRYPYYSHAYKWRGDNCRLRAASKPKKVTA